MTKEEFMAKRAVAVRAINKELQRTKELWNPAVIAQFQEKEKEVKQNYKRKLSNTNH